MDAEQVLKLFDTYWFEHEIFTKPPPLPPPTNPDPQIQNEPLQPQIFRVPTRHVRSLSDQLSSKTIPDSISPSLKSVLLTHKLQPILSGKVIKDETPKKEEEEEEEIEKPCNKVRMRGRRRNGGNSKSLSDLEFEELKGFIDLGFVFSEEDKNSSLVSIIPGLQRLGKRDDAKGAEEQDQESIDESVISRPYLSEAWEFLDQTKEDNPLMNWRIPAFGSEIDMKHHLRSWAHTVASTVK